MKEVIVSFYVDGDLVEELHLTKGEEYEKLKEMVDEHLMEEEE